MCGRYSVIERGLYERFDARGAAEATARLPHYNVSPSQTMPVVLRSADGHNRIELMEWGLIPSWSKDGKGWINARAETIAGKPTFRKPFRSQRCLIPASSFFEWKRTKQGKSPYLFKLRDEELFALAGIYDAWAGPAGEKRTYAILTCAANALMTPIHHRMPVILSRDAEGLWLDPQAEVEALTALLQPYPPELMETFPVSSAVNHARNDSPEVVERAAPAV